MMNHIQVGDEVEHIDDSWHGSATVKRITEKDGLSYAIFKEGGFWEMSRLKLYVPERTENDRKS